MPTDSPPSYPLVLTIGRSADNQIELPNPTIGRHHATLTVFSPDSFLLEDNKSKNGTFLQRDGQTTQIRRVYVGRDDMVLFADNSFLVEDILPPSMQIASGKDSEKKSDPDDFTTEFAALRNLPDAYKANRKTIRDREKKIRLWSILIAAIIGIAAAIWGQNPEFRWLAIISSAGIGILVPTLASTLLGTEDNLERLEAEFREQYRCPNRPTCKYRFGHTPWEDLADLKKCPRCKVTWTT